MQSSTRPARPLALLIGLALLLGLVSPAAAAPVRGVAEPKPLAASSTGRYIVVLAEAPLATYSGGIGGLGATDPQVTGAGRLDPRTAPSRAYLAHLGARQDAVRAAAALALGRSVELYGSYRVTINGFAAPMSAAEAGRLATLPGVARVVPDEDRYLATDRGPDWIGAPGLWDGSEAGGGAGTMGEGIVAGVIDTGVNHDHPSFADVGGDGYDHTNPRGTYYGVCAGGVVPLCNDKLIGVYDFTGTGPEDDNGHGSHTASTVAGNVVDASLVAPTVTVDRTISGVAPHANLITYKACVTTPAIGTCPLSALLLAIDQATTDMVDVVNFSIGGGSSDPWSDLDAQAFLNARAAGVFVATSAGNEGPGAATVGSPADAPWVLSVGATTHDREFVNSLVGMSGGDTAAPADMIGRSITSEFGPAPIVFAGDYGYPLCGDGPANEATGAALINPFTPGTFDGEIVVCERGTYGRVEKGENVMEGGAGGFVLVNDAASGDSTVADPYPLPGVNVSHAQGQVLLAWLASGSGHTAGIGGTEAVLDAANADVMASFSSRGPNPATGDILKPDVSAPGVDILAAFHSPLGGPAGPTEYGVISGTSMASPHAAGSAVLVLALHPDWSPAEVQSALMTSAFDGLPGDGDEVHGVLKEDGVTPADPFDTGSGRVNLHAASRAGIVLDETTDGYVAGDPNGGGDPTAINTASLANGACAGTCSWHRTLTGAADHPVTWSVSTTDDGAMSLVVEPSTLTLGPGATAVVTVTADTTAADDDAWHFGSVILTPDDPSVASAHLPVAVFAVATASSHAASVLDDPGEVSTTGDYDLTWSAVTDAVGYDVQQATEYAVVFSDDAEAGMAGRWTTEAAPDGWSDSGLDANSGSSSYWSGQTDERLSTLTLAEPISVPDGAEATLTFASSEDTEPGFDYGHVEASDDGGSTWHRFLTVNGSSGGWIERSVVLAELSGDVLVRFVYDTDELISLPLYLGWFVDDIRVEVGNWASLAQTDAGATSVAVSDQPNGTYHHRVAGRFATGGAEARGPWSNVVDITVDRPQVADLRVSDMQASNAKGRQGEKVVISATIANDGEAAAPATTTELRLDDDTVLGSVETPPIAVGSSATVSVSWDTRAVKGEHIITATADAAAVVAESNEANNTGTLTVTIQGNKVKNSSFEEANADGSGPDAWSGTSTSAGEATWTEGGSDGERSASFTGTGGNAALAGSPTWASDPIAVAPGDLLTLTASVSTEGMSSAPTLGLAYLGPAGQLVGRVTVLTAPLTSDGFAALEKSVTVPAGVASVRVVLVGFAGTDLRTAGTVTFDEIGLYGP